MNIDRVVTKLLLLLLISCWCYQGDFAHINQILPYESLNYTMLKELVIQSDLTDCAFSESTVSRGQHLVWVKDMVRV